MVLNILALSVLLALPSQTSVAIERAFLENSADTLRSVLTTSGDIPLSLPDPLSFGDQVSPDQAYFLFKQIFAVFKTSEFFTDTRLSALPGRAGGILNARWSFRNQRTGNSYPFRVFFYLVPETPAASGVPGTGRLRVVEIRAEKL
jgi:hypothetical protein